MHAVAATRDFFAIGQLAAHLQTPVREIELAADRLGIVAAMRINLILHFDGGQVRAIANYLRETKEHQDANR